MNWLREILVFVNGHQQVILILFTLIMGAVGSLGGYVVIYRAVPALIEHTSPVFSVRLITVASEDLTRALTALPRGPEGSTRGLDYQFFSSLPHGSVQEDWNMANKELPLSIPAPPRTEVNGASPYHMVYVWIANNEPAFPLSKMEIADYEFDIDVQVGGTVEYTTNEHRSVELLLDGNEAFFAVPRSALVSARRNHADKVILRQQRKGSENVGFGTKENSRP